MPGLNALAALSARGPLQVAEAEVGDPVRATHLVEGGESFITVCK
jgi:hypothetical protein